MGWLYKNKKEKISIEIDKDLYTEFCVKCAQTNVNEVIEKLIKDYLGNSNTNNYDLDNLDSINHKNTVKTGDKPKKEFIIKGQPCNGKEFECYLKKAGSCDVKRTIFYKNKESEQSIWKVKNFIDTSDINGNLSSGPLRGWKRLEIVGIKLEIE